MKPGDKMPTQHALSDAYGVSRPVIREAISLLKSEGLVLSQQGRGQFVNPEGSGVFRLKPDLADRADLTLLLEFLMSVEVAATQLAAERHTPEDLPPSFKRPRTTISESLPPSWKGRSAA
jgi:DNA-binding FadR family transcriptional regulator